MLEWLSCGVVTQWKLHAMKRNDELLHQQQECNSNTTGEPKSPTTEHFYVKIKNRQNTQEQ